MTTRRLVAVLAAVAMLASVAMPVTGADDPEPSTTTIEPSEHLRPLGDRLLTTPSATEAAGNALASDALAAPMSLSTILATHMDHVLAQDLDDQAAKLEAGPLTQEIATAWADAGEPLTASERTDLAAAADRLDPHVERALAWLVAGAHTADQLRPAVAESLSDEALATLLTNAFPGDPVDASTQRAQLLGDGPATDLVEHETALAPLDIAKLLSAHAAMATAVDRAKGELSLATSEDLAGMTEVQAAQTGDVLNASTPYGRIVVSGTSSHTYTSDAFAQIDLGGDDVWANRAGAVQADLLGLLATSPPPLPGSPGFSDWVNETRDRIKASHNVSIALDVAGDDTYTYPGYGTQGYGTQGFGAMGGFGALVDLAGQDSYDAAAFAQGAGFVGGAGFLVDGGGADTYTVIQQGQGFAQDAAGGFLADATGQDTYTAEVLAQGTGFTANLVGALIDGTGDDTYLCTGIRDFSSFVLPVGLPRPGSVCHASGFGGTGVLVDGSGTDIYRNAGAFQAMTLIGTGLLVDLEGNDHYDAAGWSNGNAVIGVAAIVDGAGSDTYRSVQSGATAWLDIYIGSNGEGYTAGLGMIADASGHDTYTSDASKDAFIPQYACGAGCSYLGGLGVVDDGAGDDAYTSELGQGGTTGGAALLLDASGSDTYDLLYQSTRGQGFAQFGVAPAGLLVTDCAFGVLYDGDGQDSYDNPVTDFGSRTDDAYWGQGDKGRGIDGTAGTVGYATQQAPVDLEDLLQRRACEQVTGL